MCTAITYLSDSFYFGRNLDAEHNYGGKVAVMPENFPVTFSNGEKTDRHNAVIGMAAVADNYPLYFDGINDKGLAMAGLRFAGETEYRMPEEVKINIAAYEFILWVLACFDTLAEVKEKLENINITDIPFRENIPNAHLHWIIADKTGAVTVEATKDGVMIYENPVGVLTNRPSFDMQMQNLSNYMGLSSKQPENRFGIEGIRAYSLGMGAIGLPGDFSSMSRFVRTAFAKANAVTEQKEEKAVSQFFHILKASEQIKGCTVTENGEFEYTRYTSCCNADKGIYYYTTYENSEIRFVDMHKVLDKTQDLAVFPI